MIYHKDKYHSELFDKFIYFTKEYDKTDVKKGLKLSYYSFFILEYWYYSSLEPKIGRVIKNPINLDSLIGASFFTQFLLDFFHLTVGSQFLGPWGKFA